MMTEHEKLNNHEKFKELGALATSGTLTGSERADLKDHLETCEECRQIYDQYLILASEGIPLLAALYGDQEEKCWRDLSTRMKLFARVQSAEQQTLSEPTSQMRLAAQPNLLWRILVNPLTSVGLAACFVVAVGLLAYHLSSRAQTAVKQVPASAEDRFQKLAAEKEKSVEELLDADKKKLFQLQEERSQMDQELAKLRSALHTMDDRANILAAANSAADEQLRTVSQQRDALSGQLRDAQQAYDNVQAEITSLHAERDKGLQRAASFETRIEELSAINREVQRKLRDDEQYLASDQDIRELMGARKLYIADVFDVDGSSRTRKPFGRVFYTQGKSLIFYAFDLDDQPNLKNTSTFQAWGRGETGQGRPLNLGILYMDNESNRRWVLRCNNPKQLGEIDSVFVTVEPQGGSQRPTGKPFLYAMLRKEANHP